MDELNTIQKLAVLALPVLFAITVHEAAHGWIADKLGDKTARMLGRITLTPIRHIDPIGTVIIPIGMFLLSGFLFGWAKPVPVDTRNLRNPRRDMGLVAAAGPLSNLVMALFWALVLRLTVEFGDALPWAARPLLYMGSVGVLINAILMVLNLIPILPLDGGRVLSSLLPPRMAATFSRVEPYGLIIIVALLYFRVLGGLINPGIELVQQFAYMIVGLNS